MSWMPFADPILGDKRTCDALELVVVPRVRDLGDGFEVRRALPSDKRQMVGPFIFFDHMGPAQFSRGTWFRRAAPPAYRACHGYLPI
jgi:redox-sensitive bicupin YhaK (pirin superfamily)